MSETKLYQNLHPEHPGSIGPKRAGRRARFSFIGTDENGLRVRKWHREVDNLPPGKHERVAGASLRGQVRP